MLFAVTQRVVEHEAYDERRDALAHDWAVWLERSFPDDAWLAVPNRTSDPSRWCERFEPDVLVLSGGNDLDEAADRDGVEEGLVRWFLGRGRPVVGVCRGLHVVNRHYGGKVARVPGHVAVQHSVDLLAPMAGLAGAETMEVNSFHGLAVTGSHLGEGLIAAAHAGDGTVEAVVHHTDPVMAIQWHPERPHADSEATNRIIRRFIEGSSHRG